MNTTPSKEDFLKSVKDHVMTINLDHNGFRDITIKNPDTNSQMFHVTTRPYYITICGDMGTYVFSRNNDMFEFFRNDDLSINPHYYREKLQSECKYSPSIEFSCKTIIDELYERLENFKEECEDGNDEYCYETAEQEIKHFERYVECSENEYVYAINNWNSESAGGMELDDFWDGCSGKTYSYHYIWCLYAITYTIKLYDGSKIENDV